MSANDPKDYDPSDTVAAPFASQFPINFLTESSNIRWAFMLFLYGFAAHMTWTYTTSKVFKEKNRRIKALVGACSVLLALQVVPAFCDYLSRVPLAFLGAIVQTYLVSRILVLIRAKWLRVGLGAAVAMAVGFNLVGDLIHLQQIVSREYNAPLYQLALVASLSSHQDKREAVAGTTATPGSRKSKPEEKSGGEEVELELELGG
ncbi:GMC oxidoreductase [Pseudohyphozyma bogoriensis]|nr:GMC oxidoreductase [Pseudohyphozyma bogoriensis]